MSEQSTARFDSTIQSLVHKADSILKNRVIAAALMLYQGIMILVIAGHRSDFMAQGIAISMALAAGASLSQLCAGKGWRLKSAVPLAACVVLAVVIYLFPKPMGFALRYLVALSVLTVGIANVAQTFHLTRTERLLQWIKDRQTAWMPASGDTILPPQSVQSEIDRHMSATVSLIKKIGAGSKADCFLGIVMIGLGILLLISPTQGNRILDVNSGIAMIAVSLTDLAVALRLHWHVRKQRSDRFQSN